MGKSTLQDKKNIHAVGVPKNIGQAKYVGELLIQLIASQGTLDNTALVLGDESLITPILNSIPPQITAFNITMGMPLNLVPMAALFESLFLLHKTAQKSKFYYKDVISIISNSYVKPILDDNLNENTALAMAQINDNNITYIALSKLKEFFPTQIQLLDLLFGAWKNDSELGLKNCLEIIQHIKSYLDTNKTENLLNLEYLFKFNLIFNQISTLLTTYSFVTDIKTLYGLYKEILNTETLDFQGEPLNGLQIIGMLESRVLDFETIIITSANEGILPSGKSNNSFIPFDVKLEYGLPTYKEKDAVYTYHFYHLLQRAKHVYILYNTEVDALNGGEKSRFITQLEAEGIHKINHFTVSPKVPALHKELKQVKKTNSVTNSLKELALSGFSPSALTSYIRNPIDFYSQKILHVNSFEDVEETLAANTFGNIIHRVLEELYKPLIGHFLTADAINGMKLKIEILAHQFFKEENKDAAFDSGKNLIAFEIIKRYVSNFLDLELGVIKQGMQIKIIALEEKLTVDLDIPELNFPVRIKGTVDRIDECDGVLRIIDYKSGRIDQNKVSLVNWEDLTTDYNSFSKSFQILTYAYLLHHSGPFNGPVEAGIISFKNLQSGFLKFTKKEAVRGGKKSTEITNEVLDFYFIELKKLILDICNAEINFVEKEI